MKMPGLVWELVIETEACYSVKLTFWWSLCLSLVHTMPGLAADTTGFFNLSLPSTRCLHPFLTCNFTSFQQCVPCPHSLGFLLNPHQPSEQPVKAGIWVNIKIKCTLTDNSSSPRSGVHRTPGLRECRFKCPWSYSLAMGLGSTC